MNLWSKHFTGENLRRAAFGLFLLGFLVSKASAQIGLPPTIIAQPLDVTALSGGTVAFQVLASSTTTMTYKWSHDGVTITGAVSSTYFIASVQPSDAGLYSVEWRISPAASPVRTPP